MLHHSHTISVFISVTSIASTCREFALCLTVQYIIPCSSCLKQRIVGIPRGVVWCPDRAQGVEGGVAVRGKGVGQVELRPLSANATRPGDRLK